MVRRNDMFIIQFERADKCLSKLGEEVKRSAQKRYVPSDRFPAGKTTDRLVDNRLKNRCGKIFLGCALVDERLYIRFCKHAAAGSNRIERLIIFGVLVQTGCVCL